MGPTLEHAKSAARLARRVAKASAAALLCYHYVGYPNIIMGLAMEPTFPGNGEVLLVERLPGMMGRAQPGDIVVCSSPIDPHSTIISRLRAVPGQHVQIEQTPGSKPSHYQVPPGYMWVKGDAPASREYGLLPMAMLQGRVVAQVWPEVKWICNSAASESAHP
ncbi:hypothetical protein OEZ86_004074 [Tetradesmus obliquus]|nr:hypothetical protein OEZ86_004074 [Tetradesmus obliquus]